MQYSSNNSRTAHQQSYETLRDMILNGTIPQGTKLVEEKLATQLGVSRTPIRESIRKLEQEGLIVNKRVVKLSETDLRNTFELRMLLEGHAAQRGCLLVRDRATGFGAMCGHRAFRLAG